MLIDPTLDIEDMTFADIDLSDIGRHIYMMTMSYGDLQTPMHLVQQEK